MLSGEQPPGGPENVLHQCWRWKYDTHSCLTMPFVILIIQERFREYYNKKGCLVTLHHSDLIETSTTATWVPWWYKVKLRREVQILIVTLQIVPLDQLLDFYLVKPKTKCCTLMCVNKWPNPYNSRRSDTCLDWAAIIKTPLYRMFHNL